MYRTNQTGAPPDDPYTRFDNSSLFCRFCEELEDISFVASLALLLEMLKSAVRAGIALTETILERMFAEFVRKTPRFLRNKMGVLTAFSMS